MTPWVEPTHFATKRQRVIDPQAVPGQKVYRKGWKTSRPLVKGLLERQTQKLEPLFRPPPFLLPVQASVDDSLG
jgi:hypothetical protein